MVFAVSTAPEDDGSALPPLPLPGATPLEVRAGLAPGVPRRVRTRLSSCIGRGRALDGPDRRARHRRVLASALVAHSRQAAAPQGHAAGCRAADRGRTTDRRASGNDRGQVVATGVYTVVTDASAQEQVDALPTEALTSYAELRVVPRASSRTSAAWTCCWFSGLGSGAGRTSAARGRVRSTTRCGGSGRWVLAAARRRCADLIREGRVRIGLGTAENTGLNDTAVDVVLSVNSVQLWTDRHEGLCELFRVLRPGGRLLLSAHEKWLPGGRSALAGAVQRAGYEDVDSWTWEPPGRGATTAVQLCARRPGAR